MQDIQQLYRIQLREAILNNFAEDFLQANAGTCMKLVGLPLDDLLALREAIKDKYTGLQVVVLSDTQPEDFYVSATRLIELRNNATIPLLALIPSTIQTPAEDSYGNATFKNLFIDHIDNDILNALKSAIPLAKKEFISACFEFAKCKDKISQIYYLLAVSNKRWDHKAIGLELDWLGLVPDTNVSAEPVQWRTRLFYNQQSTEFLSDFTTTVPNRIARLQILPDTNQQDIAIFLNQSSAKDKVSLMHGIRNSENFTALDFANWKIPEINKSPTLRLKVGELTSPHIKINDGDKTLSVPHGKTATLKLRITLTPAPKDYPTLRLFRIMLVSTDGMTEVCEAKHVKVTDNNRAYRDVTLKASSDMYEEGTYFFRVIGEDEAGSPLNVDDDFISDEIQHQWEQAKKAGAEYSTFKALHQTKSINETEEIFFNFADSDEDDNDGQRDHLRKDKLDNAMQAYFRYRIDKLKNKEEADLPNPDKKSAAWLELKGQGLQKIFHLKLGVNHNYQIPVSNKLFTLEKEILQHAKYVGHVTCRTYANPAFADFEQLTFHPFERPEFGTLLSLRKQIFSSILASSGTETENGVFETWIQSCAPENIVLLKSYVREYLKCYDVALLAIKNASVAGNNEAFSYLTRLQDLDTVTLTTPITDGKEIRVKLIPPLHPLRLAWFINLYDLFTDWEHRTISNRVHIKEWNAELMDLFLGDIYPSNNPLILAQEPSRYFQYSGEIVLGWGIFTQNENRQVNSILSNERQIKIYVAEQLNLACETRIDTDVSQELIGRYIKHYIKQHPYTDKLIVNIFNPGDGASFVKALIALEQKLPNKYQYEFRLCCDDDFIAPGEAFRELMNPESNISEKAESFSTVAANRLFPKIRFSLNRVSEFRNLPYDYIANLSFLVNPFASQCLLLDVNKGKTSDAVNGLVVKSIISLKQDEADLIWNKSIYCSETDQVQTDFFYSGNSLLNKIQEITATVMNPLTQQKIPGTSVSIRASEKMLLSLIHDCSDWVITFDRSIGPEIFDSYNTDNEYPYLLDFVPSKELSGISAFLTTRPGIETYRFLQPYLKKIGLDNLTTKENLLRMLEDIRTISGSLLLQAISTNNRAFEVIGLSLTKRMLEKKGYLKDAFLIPIDLHQNLFDIDEQETKRRADLLLVQCDLQTRTIHLNVVEIKCRATLNSTEQETLMEEVYQQIDHSIEAFKTHFEIGHNSNDDRLNRQIKCLELQKLFEFYINRSARFLQLRTDVQKQYLAFCASLNQGYELSFDRLEIIYNFSAAHGHQKEQDEDFTRYTIGKQLIDEIMDTDSDLNTIRLEETIRHVEIPAISVTFTPQIEIPAHESKPTAEYVAEPEPARPVEVVPELSETQSIGHKEIWMTNATGSSSAAASESEISSNNTPDDASSVEEPSPVVFDTIIGSKSTTAKQFGILGTQKINNHKIALDLDETTTISLFGVQGAGKSYTIGTITEMVLKQIPQINQLPTLWAGVIFHYSESMDYAPEFTSMVLPNDKPSEIQKLLEQYNASPDAINDLLILTPASKVDERRAEYPNIEVQPIAFNSKELNVKDWQFLLGAIGNDSMYIKQINAIMRKIRNDLNLEHIKKEVQQSPLLSNAQKTLADQRFLFAEEYIDDSFTIGSVLRPGRLVLVDLRDEFIHKDEALGLFVVMLNIFSGVLPEPEKSFNKFIVFDEAHKYMDNKDLTNNIVTAIREMRHKGVSLMIASQDPLSLPTEIIELSSVLLMHKFNSPAWLKHIQKSITQVASLNATDLSSLAPGEAYLWSNKSSDKQIEIRPIKIMTRPRVTKHGGETIKATAVSVQKKR